MNPQQIKQFIEIHIPGSTAIINTEDNVHFNATVISELFSGKSKLQQQQMVNEAIQKFILSGEIHAISLKTFTPEIWEKQNG
jgi:acid stress-induced BolA-like protein IbaG/YrbA